MFYDVFQSQLNISRRQKVIFEICNTVLYLEDLLLCWKMDVVVFCLLLRPSLSLKYVLNIPISSCRNELMYKLRQYLSIAVSTKLYVQCSC